MLVRLLLLPLSLGTGAPSVLVVGGGPDPRDNQVAIEKNVEWVGRLVPSARVLFADGRLDHETVRYLDRRGAPRTRRPSLHRIDGPATMAGLDAEIERIAAQASSAPVVLYFTGHGVPAGHLLWGGRTLRPSALARRLDRIPPERPVFLVMTQCFSGAFADLVLADDRDVAGFFATTADRPATGCTPEVDEADYRDFSSYFFAALFGRDRTGVEVRGDADQDGRIGLDEAFAHALVAAMSIDVPVPTSDAFLRHVVRVQDADVMDTPYSLLETWATPAQLRALEGLSRSERLRGEDRLRRAYDAFRRDLRRRRDGSEAYARRLRFVRLAKSVILGHRLLEEGDAPLRARFLRLRAAEASNPFTN